ncbi:MAG: tetratricopeptide repeat protein [Deltaproteobacteria bacterium]|nr:tetratricopeptide repeat protein [Deltaproteobacteria bacterium]
MIRDGAFDQAAALLKEILDAKPDDVEARLRLVWAEFLRDAKAAPDEARRKAEEKLQSLTRERGGDERPHYYLGRVALRLEDYRRAQTHFRKAHEINPDSVETNRELRLLSQRMQSIPEPAAEADDASKKGLLGGLFGKKR